MSVLKRMWTQSILMRVGVALGVVTLIALAVILVATLFTEQSTGKAGAINVAGSLRMQSYSMATRVASLPEAAGDGRTAALDAIDGFEARLHSPMLVDALPKDADAELRRAYAGIVDKWQDSVRPLARAAIADAAMRPEFLAVIDRFVARIDEFVVLLERDAEARIQGLRLWLGIAFLVIFALVITAISLLQVEVFQPLSELLRSARAVRTGSFRARVNATGPDEMGQLGQAFNSMVEQLARLYGSLEKQVAEKTADLERKNRSLSLLYETTRLLSEKPLDAQTLQSVLTSLSRSVGAEAAVICARHAGCARGQPLAGDEALRADLYDRDRCANCISDGRLGSRTETTERGEQRIVNVPLLDGGVTYGVMPLRMPPGRAMEAWQLELAQTIGRHVGAALAAAERREEHQRLSLLEERSAIARELHDSLAQSLSYTKIQLTRLSALLDADGRPHAAQVVLDELREGVSSAYRQLRELLTTFRMKVGGASFDAALREVIADCERRAGLPVRVDGELAGLELSANAQIHVLQIVREALTNIEKHARARAVSVGLQRQPDGGFSVEIEDDGVGIASGTSPAQHFGLDIMRDRAALLGGSVEIGRRRDRGTRVTLRVPARPPAAAAAPAARAGETSGETV
ncbi:MAG: type IV pili methyl-accepting chemotaxis transducer N-terminal domain-containing protein [Burkholderiales bacterium]|nr:type IV pili methyl-accepting chemotaxis transducer N-terminal domain-containing protein [Burkholderiales bacterium]